MERTAIKEVFGKNFLGKEEITLLIFKLGLDADLIEEPTIPYSERELRDAAIKGYILVYGVGQVNNVNINLYLLRNIFGVDPDKSEPCLYNQDWYMREDFMNLSLSSRWYLIKKEVFEESRAVMPADLREKGLIFPSAILCAYTFFAYYFAHKEYLWFHDFIWCSDVDHNGDRIYVGKYHDIDGVNKNGFSIHRHLALRPCYAGIDYI